MRSRWLSTFSILGFLLVILGVVGIVLGPKFVFDPGQIPDGHEAWYYIVVGALMLLNGFVSPALTVEEKKDAARTQAASTRPVEPRPAAVATASDNSGDKI
jgi:uncharacterized membrane protein